MDKRTILRLICQSGFVKKKFKNNYFFIFFFSELKNKHIESYKMLLIISLFPHGVCVEDLRQLEKKKKIPHNWLKIM